MIDLIPKPDEMTDKYRAVFMSSPMGLEVLADILTECHFGCTLQTEVQMNEHNIGTVILAKCGVFARGTRMDVIRALSTVIPSKEVEDEQD